MSKLSIDDPEVEAWLLAVSESYLLLGAAIRALVADPSLPLGPIRGAAHGVSATLFFGFAIQHRNWLANNPAAAPQLRASTPTLESLA